MGAEPTAHEAAALDLMGALVAAHAARDAGAFDRVADTLAALVARHRLDLDRLTYLLAARHGFPAEQVTELLGRD